MNPPSEIKILGKKTTIVEGFMDDGIFDLLTNNPALTKWIMRGAWKNENSV